MCLMRYVVTGGTGFIGRRVVSRLLDNRPDAEVWVLVRRSSLGRFERLAGRDFFLAFARGRCRLASALATLENSFTLAATVPRAEPMVVATLVSNSSAPDGFCSSVI